MRRLRPGLVVFALLAIGCGVDEYEEKMKSEQARVERLDKEFKELDAPLSVPELKEDAHNEIEVFVRPPRGLPSSAYRDDKGTLPPGPFFWYLASDTKKPINAVLIAIAENSDKPLDPKDLVEKLGGVGSGTLEWKKDTIKPSQANRKPFEVNKTVFVNNNGKYFLFLDAKNTAAVCYRTSGKQEDQAVITKEVNASIETFAVGRDEVSKLLAEYKKRAVKPRK